MQPSPPAAGVFGAVPTLLLQPPVPFGQLLRQLRVRVGLSQNQLARQGGVDPAYVNRLERAKPDSTSMPSRKVVLALWSTIVEAGRCMDIPSDPDQREALLVAAGHCPEIILEAGGWDQYVRRLRHEVLDSLNQTLRRFDDALGSVS